MGSACTSPSEHEGQIAYWTNTTGSTREDRTSSLCRATVNRGEDAHTDGKFAISDKGAMEIMRLFLTPDEQLQDKRITDFFDDEVFSSNFWLYWRTMFAFENWHSALENEALYQALHPSHRRPAGLQGALTRLQPV